MWSKQKILTTASLALLLVMASGCGSPASQGSTEPVTNAKIVGVTKVESALMEQQSALSAEVIPFVELDVIVKADGDIAKVHKKRGDQVAKDEVILEIDKTDIAREKQKVDAAMTTASEQYEKAKKDLADTQKELTLSIDKTELAISELERDYAKLRNDYDLGLIEKRQLQTMETKLEQTRLDLELLHDKKQTLETSNPLSQAEYQLTTARLAYEDWERAHSYYDVKSPISGVLTYMPAEEGMTVQKGLQIAKVQQQDLIKVKAQLTESYLPLVANQETLSFTHQATGESFTGKVIYVSPTANLQTKTYELELQTDNSQGKLKPGMRVQLQLSAAAAAPSMVVPEDAVLRDKDESYVFVLKGEQAEKRMVVTGRLTAGKQEIVSGLESGETIIVRGHLRLADGDRVSVEGQQ
ncbi:efflux RND transporter periplasmic adaptor subunit [Paenibacillus turpanensis]|uniref:efflux RND transporter periplasmic adaptor subunit n=1 Tax=Paenibacillus turpanensis TaxID=2689078 RepID=UPI00140DB787|nr:efflux RND transporter periplasmic adaptor subunit [Paenibacillus turpanensis]